MANYDPKRGRPVTDVETGPSQVDALLDQTGPIPIITPGPPPAVMSTTAAESPQVPPTPAAVVDLRRAEEPKAAPEPIGSARPARSPIEPVPGPDPRSKRAVSIVLAVIGSIGIGVLVGAIRRSRRS